ncbi:hypothetical protein CFK41_13890 [Brachybacterium ginsengisoli]|uniref:Uncharacterized protein n=1 Tax=Brachybacterium ginsengisoli TaxID=1331682 RepID=A0A291GZW1_9MICO|nr:hypothetical protein CFK41_13890 [Brachybacterium ginsengisoli]
MPSSRCAWESSSAATVAACCSSSVSGGVSERLITASTAADWVGTGTMCRTLPPDSGASRLPEESSPTGPRIARVTSSGGWSSWGK